MSGKVRFGHYLVNDPQKNLLTIAIPVNHLLPGYPADIIKREWDKLSEQGIAFREDFVSLGSRNTFTDHSIREYAFARRGSFTEDWRTEESET
jgi:hypothetical protein